MSSPFKTSQEFLEVKGPLYTFANSPVWLTIFLIFSVIIFLWFIYASYKIKSDEPSASDPAVMSVLILTSFISLAQSAYISGTTVIEAYRLNKHRISTHKNFNPSRKTARNKTGQYYSSRSQREKTTRRG